MKKIIAALLCITLTVCGIAAAETTQKEDYIVVTVNGAFNIRGNTPVGYRLVHKEDMESANLATFLSEDPEKPYFDLVISFLEEYAGVERLNDLTEVEMKELVDDDPTLSSKIEIMETEYGTKVMILRSNNSLDDFVCFVTIYKGYEVALNLFPGESGEPLTEEQIAWAMQFLSDLDFVPVNTDQK